MGLDTAGQPRSGKPAKAPDTGAHAAERAVCALLTVHAMTELHIGLPHGPSSQARVHMPTHVCQGPLHAKDLTRPVARTGKSKFCHLNCHPCYFARTAQATALEND